MDEIIQYVYYNFLDSMNYGKHVFITDYYTSLQREKIFLKNSKTKELDYKPLENINTLNCVFEPKRILSLDEAKEIYIKYIRLDKQKDIEKLLNKYVNFYLSGTVTDIKVEKEKKNILIVGGGPSGMFTALYLQNLYGNRINIQLIDTRIKEENIRLPFTRNRFFFIETANVFKLIYGFGCFSKNKEFVGMMIKHFELLLYCVCVNNGINMLFTEKYKTFESLKEILPKYDILFDCSGNRLDYKITKNIPKFKTIKSNNMVISQNGNEIEVNWQKTPQVIHFLNIEYLNKNYELTGSDVGYFYSLNKIQDIEMFKEKRLNGCFTKKDAIKIISAIRDKKTREIIYNSIKGNYVKFQYFEVKQRHKLLITDYIGKTLYLAIGDTAFYSHFLTGAGLQRMFNMIAHICHLLDIYI
jgi:hypothetical protein